MSLSENSELTRNHAWYSSLELDLGCYETALSPDVDDHAKTAEASSSSPDACLRIRTPLDNPRFLRHVTSSKQLAQFSRMSDRDIASPPPMIFIDLPMTESDTSQRSPLSLHQAESDPEASRTVSLDSEHKVSDSSSNDSSVAVARRPRSRLASRARFVQVHAMNIRDRPSVKKKTTCRSGRHWVTIGDRRVRSIHPQHEVDDVVALLNKGTPVSRVHNITPMRSGSIELIVRTMGKSRLPIVNIDGHEYHTQLSRRNMRTIHEAFLRGDDIKSIVQRDGPSRNTIENLRNEGGFGGRWRVFNVGAYTYHTQFELGDVKKIHEGYEAGKSFARLSRLVGIHADSIEAMINQRALSSP